MERTAGCHCGEVRLACRGEPLKVSMCHCPDCQRRSGSAFSVAVFFQRADVVLAAGAVERFERGSASGHPVAFYFCGRCGSNLFWEPSRTPHLTGVALGAFADPDFPAPVQSVWTKDKHRWLRLPETIAQFDGLSSASAPAPGVS